MTRLLGGILASACVLGLSTSTRADDPAADAIVEKAIKAVGGEELARKAGTARLQEKGALTIDGADHEFTLKIITHGPDRVRVEFEGDFDGNRLKATEVIHRNEGWSKHGEQAEKMDDEHLAASKHRHQLDTILAQPTILKEKGFKLETAGEAKVNDKPAAGLKVTLPNGKDALFYFDKESGLPVRFVARVAGFGNDEYEEERTASDFKTFDGYKRATKITSKRNGEKFIEAEVTEFKPLEKVDPETFTEPQ